METTLLLAFAVIFILAALLFIFYRRIRAAYRELVRQSQQWAPIQSEKENDTDESKTQNTLPPDDTDFFIMKEIERWMTEEKLYKDNSLSVGLLAQKIGMKRHNVSVAINKCAQKSFNTFINEYRIKEAIQLLSKPNAKDFTVDSIAYDCGFTDRKNFYRVFKKLTGLSPTEFKNNLLLNG